MDKPKTKGITKRNKKLLNQLLRKNGLWEAVRELEEDEEEEEFTYEDWVELHDINRDR